MNRRGLPLANVLGMAVPIAVGLLVASCAGQPAPEPVPQPPPKITAITIHDGKVRLVWDDAGVRRVQTITEAEWESLTKGEER